ncbi:hypothetical protein NW762_011626 [Fusarium torreyae]|uniref:PDZ domain-containing protein n=1 Tax=Fusarium torreyae TaxID=1237075 RepID=A0A9W8RST5_9HYPO|nr:hypothetical protein NW762_011626 [Fusarium torreyae]
MAQRRDPCLDVTITPTYESAFIKSLEVRLIIENPNLTACQTLVEIADPEELHPVRPYPPNAVKASDLNGELALIAEDTEDGQWLWNVARETTGDVVVTYTATHINNDLEPIVALLDLRRDHNGINGAGICLFILPPDDKTYSISLGWDLSQAPDGTRAIWTHGEGPEAVEKVGSTKILSESHFAIGPSLHSYPPATSASSGFGFYWFGDPNFDVLRLAEWAQNLFQYMQSFFHDSESAYSIFLRASASSRGTGGAALLRSFMFNYVMTNDNDFKNFQTLLAHEMVHNWPTLSEDDDGDGEDTTWFVEGIADYYSLILPFRAGSFILNRFARHLNFMATAYYTNPMVNLTNQEAADQDSENQDVARLPYGRGMFFFIRLDALLRARSNDQRSIDDVVLKLLHRTRSGQSNDLECFLELLELELGPAAREEYQAMSNGKLMVPPENSLGPSLSAQQIEMEQFEVGFEQDRDQNGLSFVSKVFPNSRAAEAGLLQGDEILSTEDRFSHPDINFTYEDIYAETHLKLWRNGKQLSISYRPRSFRKVQAYQWVRKDDNRKF